MPTTPLVSAIIIFHNEEEFLEDAIQSVIAQTYPDWELLLADDGSTDASTQIAKCYARREPGRIFYLDHEGHRNCGASASRNLGINHARGEFLAFLDGDDVWLPHKLEQQVPLLQARPDVGLLYASTEYWHSWTDRPEDKPRDRIWAPVGVAPNAVVEPPHLLTTFLMDDAVPCTGSLLLRRSAALGVGGYEEYFRYIYTDQAFYAKLALRERVLVANGCWDRYRQHNSSCCHVIEQSGLAAAARLNYLLWLEKLLAQHQVQDAALTATVRKQISWYRPGESADSKPPARKEGLVRKWCNRIAQFGSLQRARKRANVHSSNGHDKNRQRAASIEMAEPPVVSAPDLRLPRRLEPVSREWGYDRGRPIDRYYIENFLARHANDVCGRALEIGDDAYTRQFGGERITERDILHVEPGNPQATIIGDLTRADHIPSDVFDCIILTQTLQLIYDTQAALTTLRRILKPNGVLLATVPGITRISHSEFPGSWYWRFTKDSARRLFEEVFPAANVTVESHGNVLAAAAFLYGYAVEEVRQEDLDHCDPDYDVLIAVRAVRPPEEDDK